METGPRVRLKTPIKKFEGKKRQHGGERNRAKKVKPLMGLVRLSFACPQMAVLRGGTWVLERANWPLWPCKWQIDNARAKGSPGLVGVLFPLPYESSTHTHTGVCTQAWRHMYTNSIVCTDMLRHLVYVGMYASAHTATLLTANGLRRCLTLFVLLSQKEPEWCSFSPC